MYKKYLITTTLSLLLLTINNFATSRAILTGRLSPEITEVKLRLRQWNSLSRSEGAADPYHYVSVNNGMFKIEIIFNSEVEHLTLIDEANSVNLLDNLYIEDGDSIHLDVKEISENAEIIISGSNEKKFNLFKYLSKIDIAPVNLGDTKSNKLKSLDSLKDLKINKLNENKKYLSDNVFNTAIADINGDANFKTLQFCFEEYLSFDVSYQKKLFSYDIQLFNTFISRTPPLPEKYILSSDDYINYLYFKFISVYHQKTQKGYMSFEELYNFLYSKNTGKIRDKILTKLFLNSFFFSYYGTGIEPDLYKKLLRKTIDISTDPYSKTYLTQLLSNNTIGSHPFNFRLRKDTSDTYVKLSDLKGKVVLIDMYSYLCTGCYSFATTFHKNIYPSLKSDTNFVVVSIMLQPKGSQFGWEHYLERIRGKGEHKYTFPDYLNLYAAEGEIQADTINNHYKVYAAPFIFLVDKKGLVYSTSLPLFVDENTQNISLLKKDIQALLKM